MLRAIIVNIGTVAGVSAALLYQPQADVLEFTGGVLSGGGDTTIEQGQEPDTTNSNTPDATNPDTNTQDLGSNSGNGKNKPKKKNGKNNGGSPSPSSSSGGSTPSPSSSSASPDPTKSATPTPTPSKSVTPTPTPSKTKTPTPTPTPTANDKDGTYNGTRVAVYYVDGGSTRQSGNLKIQVVIKNGKVADILWTEYPTGDHQKYTNKAYTASAKPLIGLTIAELKAKKVATKTGATGTSTAFVTSLESVLQQL